MKTVLSNESIATLNQIIHSEHVLINLVHESTMLLESHFSDFSSKEMNSHFEKYVVYIISHEIPPQDSAQFFSSQFFTILHKISITS